MTENIEFKELEAKLVGNDTVCFRLEDGTLVKVKVDVGRAGIAINYKNPDGSPYYDVRFFNKISFVRQDKKFFVPKSEMQLQASPKDSSMKPV